MERSFQIWRWVRIVGQFVIFMVVHTTFAGITTRSLDDAFTGAGSDEEFAESRFGTSPHSRPLAIKEDGLATFSMSKKDRRPAGLEFTSDIHRKTASTEEPAASTEERSVGNTEKPSHLKPLSPSRIGVQEVSIIAGELGFFPKTVFVTRDIPVKLFVTGASKRPLCIILDPFQVRKQVRAQRIEEIDFTPSTAGQFRFYCPINGMEGTLFVKDSPGVQEALIAPTDILSSNRMEGK